MNHSRKFRSKLKIAHAIAVQPDIADELVTPYIKDMEVKVMKFNLPGWDESSRTVPSMNMISRLIYLSDDEPDDPYCLNKFRIRPQVYDSRSENYLQLSNNRIIHELEDGRLNPTAFDTALSQWCSKYGVNYEYVSYFQSVITYCRTILPISSTNEGTNSQRIKAMKELLSLAGKGITTDKAIKKAIDLQKGVEESNKQDYYLARRFYEYGLAAKQIKGMMLNPAYFEMWDSRLVDANRITTDNRTAKKTRSVGILTQCMFCYRFHYQDTKGRNKLSKYCPDHKNDFNNWGTYLSKNTKFKESDVYRDGFYRFEF
jgi:hypothetical protein